MTHGQAPLEAGLTGLAVGLHFDEHRARPDAVVPPDAQQDVVRIGLEDALAVEREGGGVEIG